MVAWRRCCIDDQAKSSAHIAAFNLSNHKIQMPLLILWPTVDVGAV
jgi:hypothetical protein